MKIDLEVEGMAALIGSFEKVERGFLDLRQLGTWDWVQSEFYKVVKDQFAAEGQGKSGKWKPLSSKYAAVKSKRYGNAPILQASGRLYKSMTAAGGEAIVDKQPQEMTLGSTVPYGKYHQGGTNRMPKRPIIDFTDAQEKQIFAPIGKKLRQLIDNAKLRDIRGF